MLFLHRKLKTFISSNYLQKCLFQCLFLGHSDVIQDDIHTTGEPIKSQYRSNPVGLRDKAIQEKRGHPITQVEGENEVKE